MGGERETILTQDAKNTGGITLGNIRCHENKGYIHFHDDANKHKVAVPTGIWFRLYERLMSETPNKIKYADPLNQTMLTVKSKITKTKIKKKERKEGTDLRQMSLNVSVEITPLAVNHLVATLQKFTEG